jgi:sodium-dependent dicarboxylate transporter 2/3/5
VEGSAAWFRPLPAVLVAVAATAVALIPMPGFPVAAHRTLVILIAVGGLWLTEALPVSITALLIPVLGVTLGVADAKAAFAGFGDPIVFMFFGTFLLIDAATTHGLHERLTRSVLGSPAVQRSPSRLLWAIAILGCGISAWVNNTATTALLLPLARTADRFGSRRLLVAILLMTSYAPSLGGIATPVGTAPNLIGLRLLEQFTGRRPSFAEWCVMFAPLAILTTAMAAGYLQWRVRGEQGVRVHPPAAEGRRPWSSPSARSSPGSPVDHARHPGAPTAAGRAVVVVRLPSRVPLGRSPCSCCQAPGRAGRASSTRACCSGSTGGRCCCSAAACRWGR